MSSDLPTPLVAADLDVRDLDGFMLNVERLMASELVALSSHEVVAAALFLWCRAWKQLPAASLPDDDRVIAAFSRLPLPRYRKLKAEVLRGFVKCSDGRLYHRTLAGEAVAAFARKRIYLDRREKDAERLKQWRLKHARNGNETTAETEDETQVETRFVREGQDDTVRYDTVRDLIEEREDAAPICAAAVPSQGLISESAAVLTPEADLFRRGKEVLGSSAGGLVRKLLSAKGGNLSLARAAIETASTKEAPREYVGAAINGAAPGSRDMGGIRSSRDM